MKKIVLLVLLSPFLSAAPGYGVIAVIDTAHIAKTITNYYELVKHTENLIRILQDMDQNLLQMDHAVKWRMNNHVAQVLSDLITAHDNTRGIVMHYQRVQDAYDRLYPGFEGYNGMSAKDYALRAVDITRQAERAIFDAMRAQGFVAHAQDDYTNLNALLQHSDISEGALQALQAANQIGGIQITQLMRLQEIVAASSRAQASFYATQIQADQAAQQHMRNVMQDWGKRSSYGKVDSRTFGTR